jgi:hypothetical protein
MQIGREAPHSFAVAPAPCAERVSGRGEQAVSGNAQPAGRPDTTAARSCLPADDLPRIMQRYPYDPTVIVTTVAEMTAERYVEHVIKYREGRALVLITCIED